MTQIKCQITDVNYTIIKQQAYIFQSDFFPSFLASVSSFSL
jgi:hypothetical protein